MDSLVVALVSPRKKKLSKVAWSRFVCVFVCSNYLHHSVERSWQLEVEGKVESTPEEHT